MKALTKTALAAAALAAALALAALACSSEVELTAPDWKEYDSQRNAKYTDNLNGASVAPSITEYGNGSNLPLPSSSSATISDERKQLTLRFPANADFLKKENSGIESALKEFLSIYTYTNPAAASPEFYALSAKGSDISYTFVRRSNDGDNTDITIQLDISPLPTAQGTPTTGAVIKIDAAKYKVGGFGIDRDNDGKAGEAIYDDVFRQIAVAGGPSTYIPPGGGRTLTLTIGTIPSPTSFVANAASKTITVATLTGGGIGDSSPASADFPGNIRRKAILEPLAGKFKIQKFDAASGKWNDVSGASVQYQNTATEGTFGSLYVAGFTVEDLGIYRIYASGLKGLKTSGQADFYGAEQKIGVSGGAGGALRTDDYASANAAFRVESRQLVTAIGNDPGQLPISVTDINYNNAGKKATLVLEFGGIEYTGSGSGSGDYYLDTDVKTFTDNFKIAYRTSKDWNPVDYATITQDSTNDSTNIYLDDVSKFSVGDKIKLYDNSGATVYDVTYVYNSVIPNNNYITINQSVYVYLNNYVYKVIYINNPITALTDNPATPLIIEDHSDIAFAKISKVEIEKKTDSTGSQNGTKVTITFDDSFSFTHGSFDLFNGGASILIAPGFKYGYDSLTFGDFAAIDIVIDGVRGWKLYN